MATWWLSCLVPPPLPLVLVLTRRLRPKSAILSLQPELSRRLTNQRGVLWSRDRRSTNHSSPDEEVGRLEVAVHDVAGVEVSHAAQQLQHVAPAHSAVNLPHLLCNGWRLCMRLE